MSLIISSFAGGKTTLLELLAELTSCGVWNGELCPDSATLAVLQSSVAITVTYNSGMDAKPVSYDADPETGLALRIVYSALVHMSAAFPFEAFWLAWREHVGVEASTVSLRAALEAVQVAMLELDFPTRSSILLLIDEPRKLAEAYPFNSNRVSAILSAVGGVLDTYPVSQVNAAFTTLDAVMLKAVSTASRRPITWVGVNGLLQDTVEHLFMLALRKSLPLPASVPAIISLLISDCARHPRTLEHALDVLLVCAAQTAEGLCSPDLLNRLRCAVIRYIEPPPLWAIRCALNGTPLLLSTVVGTRDMHGAGLTLGDAIADGIFLNMSATADAAVVAVPQLSFLHLLSFAMSARAQYPEICGAICCMAAQEEVGIDAGFGGDRFEAFVCNWLRLRFGLASSAPDGLSLVELLYPASLPPVPPLGKFRMTTVPRVAGWDSLPLTALPVFFADAVLSKKHISAFTDVNGAACLVTFKECNPAFDMLLVAREIVTLTTPMLSSGTVSSSAIMAVAFEARFSLPGSHVMSQDLDVNHKLRLFRQQDRDFATLGVPLNWTALVYFSSRDGDITPEARADYLSQSVYVLNREAVAAALTPTLTDRAFFLQRLSATCAPSAQSSRDVGSSPLLLPVERFTFTRAQAALPAPSSLVPFGLVLNGRGPPHTVLAACQAVCEYCPCRDSPEPATACIRPGDVLVEVAGTPVRALTSFAVAKEIARVCVLLSEHKLRTVKLGFVRNSL
jgi:hypothetical protein